MRTLQLRNDLKTLTNTEKQHVNYTGTFQQVDLLPQVWTAYLSTSFMELEKRQVKSKYLSKLGNPQKSVLCYQTFSERKGTHEKFNISI